MPASTYQTKSVEEAKRMFLQVSRSAQFIKKN